MDALKSISKEAIPRALERAERYRLSSEIMKSVPRRMKPVSRCWNDPGRK
jgi:hypothetical protein